ncbi:MAG: undecaprenyldiphospho-muramoylpentapeptide beta-N-acetylglucosaminyltransferase [Rickettsiales bacterium]|nr:undecaprenyldiphospho-muramoylpentapeptide beta-N-acetylglucosaminyltransferase [Rickettsiales bacterium]
MTTEHPIVLAAGGTGGHIFPAESLAEELVRMGQPVVLVTDKRFADYNTQSYDGVIGSIPIHYIQAGSFGGGVVNKVKGLAKVGLGVMQARSILKKLKPKAVVGFGGYPSFPTMLAASQLRLNTVIHEQNSVLGKANRVLCQRVKRIATTYPETQRLPQECFGRVQVTGNPVRAAVRVLRDIPFPQLQDDGTLRVLVMGGSQGATIFSEVVPEAIKLLPEASRKRLRIDQQCRAADIDQTKKAYDALGMQVDLATFFTDVPARLASSHLVVCRAGASTVAELTCAGRPAVLVPYPRATDNHQYHNAQAIEDVGGGWVMPQEGFTAKALAARLESILNLPSSLTKSAEAMAGLGHTNAAEKLAKLVIDLSNGVSFAPETMMASAESEDAAATTNSKEAAA